MIMTESGLIRIFRRVYVDASLRICGLLMTLQQARKITLWGGLFGIEELYF